jgi:hypothetical protein
MILYANGEVFRLIRASLEKKSTIYMNWTMHVMAEFVRYAKMIIYWDTVTAMLTAPPTSLTVASSAALSSFTFRISSLLYATLDEVLPDTVGLTWGLISKGQILQLPVLESVTWR